MAQNMLSPRLRPVLASDFWLVGPAPKLQQPSGAPPECVDHHIFPDAGGIWHLWGCIRGTATGRMLYHWEGGSPDQAPWRQTGEIIRPDRDCGESLADWEGLEWIQSPFVVRDAGLFYFFYGGHSTGLDRNGKPVAAGDPAVECQICLMTSQDARTWKRYSNEQGYSRLFRGPGEARDPCVIRIAGVWHLYYAGYEGGDPLRPGIYLRTSTNLLQWSLPVLVHRNLDRASGRWTHECPLVVERGKVFYLFRTQDYDPAITHVFWSETPENFGIDETNLDHYIGTLPLAAPEVILDERGSEYITSCHALTRGIQICRLAWIGA